jgi:hypothetical protein
MSIEGRINVDALFHDKDGTNAINVLTLQDSSEYTTGKVSIVSGTAGTAATSFGSLDNVYRNAVGNLVSIETPLRLSFSWSGSGYRTLLDSVDTAFVLKSRSGSVAVTDINGATAGVNVDLLPGIGTGTYTILLYGT